MLKSDKDKRICDKYGRYDSEHKTRCNICPLRVGAGSYDFRCKANSHYDRKTKEWEFDE